MMAPRVPAAMQSKAHAEPYVTYLLGDVVTTMCYDESNLYYMHVHYTLVHYILFCDYLVYL